MGKPSPAIMKFMETYKVDSDEIWEAPGSGSWVIKHAALERVAAEAGITFDPPQIATREYETVGVSLLVIGKMGDKTEWSFGEASPFNLTRKSDKKPLYPWAMAEKRAKDRVILKLLNAHGGMGLYSEEEAEEFKRDNPHVNKPADFVEPTEYDEQGQPIDNIPLGDRQVTKLSKAQARKDFEAATAELRACKTVTHLQLWGSKNANRIASYPADWAEIMRGLYTDHLNDLRSGKAA